MKIASTFYAQWFDDAPVPAPPGSMVHGVLPAMPRRSFELATLPLLGHASEELVDLLH
jgi:hypothetical protein